ncbi:unnamed protein product [Mytilus coruscus]|uniref:KRAB n=1 Tax=Mytilus coruscus TaxID=42192 RepID=A0A6J8CZE0_MYTCO|nr:unnamed protein product [Mytilus coruscus]
MIGYSGRFHLVCWLLEQTLKKQNNNTDGHWTFIKLFFKLILICPWLAKFKRRPFRLVLVYIYATASHSYILQERGVNCDVTLQACDGTAYLHSIILAANSEKHIYSKISRTNENHQIDCTKYRIHVIKAVVIFLYSGELVIEKSLYDDLVKLCKDLYLNSACDSFNHQYQVTKVHPGTYDKDGVKEKTIFKREPYIHSNNSNSSFESTSTIPLENDDIPATPMKTVSRGDSLYLKVTDLKNDQGTSSDENNMETSSVEYGCTNDSRPSSSSLGENLINQIENIVMQCVDNGKKEKKGNVFPELTMDNNSLPDYVENSEKSDNKSKCAVTKSPSFNQNNTSLVRHVRKGTKRSSGSLSSDKKEKPTRKKKKTSLNKKRKVTEVIKNNKSQRNMDNDEDVKDQDYDMTEDTTNLKPKKQWKCTKCNLIFQSFSERAEHMRKLHKPYPCELCDWVGVQPHLYASHMYGQHKVVIYSERYPLVQCDVQGCAYKCLNINMKDHMRCHKYKKEKLVCHVCGMEFTSEGGLRAHSSYHKEEEMKFKCKECDKVFGWKHELSKHLTAEHKTHNLCHLCPFKSKNKTSLIVHLHNKHAEPIPEKMKTYKCDMCDFYCFYPSYLKIHKQESHSDSMNFQCNVCPKKFKSKKALRSHWDCAHSSNFYKCDKCSYTTRSQTTLQIHQQSTHSEARPFSCHLCEYSCKLKGNLNSHMKNIHKLEIVSINKLHEKVVKTGKGYDEYMEARRKRFFEPDKTSLELIETRPLDQSCGVPTSEDDSGEQYQDLLNIVRTCNLPLS